MASFLTFDSLLPFFFLLHLFIVVFHNMEGIILIIFHSFFSLRFLRLTFISCSQEKNWESLTNYSFFLFFHVYCNLWTRPIQGSAISSGSVPPPPSPHLLTHPFSSLLLPSAPSMTSLERDPSAINESFSSTSRNILVSQFHYYHKGKAIPMESTLFV